MPLNLGDLARFDPDDDEDPPDDDEGPHLRAEAEDVEPISLATLADPDKKDKLGWGWVAAPMLGQVADIVSTEFALSGGGVREANPLFQERAVRIPVKLAIGLGAGILAKKANKKWGSILLTALGAGPAVNNIIQTQRRNRRDSR